MISKGGSEHVEGNVLVPASLHGFNDCLREYSHGGSEKAIAIDIGGKHCSAVAAGKWECGGDPFGALPTPLRTGGGREAMTSCCRGETAVARETRR